MSEREPAYDTIPVVEQNEPVLPLYEQRINSLEGLPQTQLAPENLTKHRMPNIFTARHVPEVWKQHEDGIPMHAVSGKADVGGVGGHVEVADEVKAAGLDFILRHNRDRKGRKIFRSIVPTHTGDDVAYTGIVEERVMENPEVVEELLWETFMVGSEVARKLGLYGPGQDLKADAYTGNIHGMGPAFIDLPLPIRSKAELATNASQSVLVAFGDKTEPAVMNWMTNFAYRTAHVNTGLTIAESRMKNGYQFSIVDVNTKQQAIEKGIPANDDDAINKAMKELGKGESVAELSDSIPSERKLLDLVMTGTTRYVIDRVWSQNEDGARHSLGVVVSAERLHNIETSKGFVYGGKDDPNMLALCQGDWPAPGEITSKLRITPLVNGDCRGSHRGPLYPAPINSQTHFWSGPIISVMVMSVNLETGRIGDISDQLGYGTMWDKFRADASDRFDWIRAHGYMEPAVLAPDELEYQPQVKQLQKELALKFRVRLPRESTAA